MYNGTSLAMYLFSATDTNTYTITSINLPAGSEFSVNSDSSCIPGASLSGSGTTLCYLAFNFTPTTAGAQTVDASVSYQDQNGVQYSFPVVLSGTGVN